MGNRPKDWIRRHNNTPQTEGSKCCNTCYGFIPLVDYGPNPGAVDGRRGDCRPCRSLANGNKMMEKKANKDPIAYMACNNCYRIFKKYKDRKKLYEKEERKDPTECRKCKSKNIEQYV